ncbi:hypothetical protein GCK72_001820 [Caenorhabditis remanei]|uniref:Uncharacterized protein n=1 Tax=Caenorhabditis remanei TaxID=31234 RepID=A0A6A5HUT3_CAERE|nr:hypothetical protein GCK72_001820 [Caenorhabditis remanei]KAF1770003.1 hypothetical protein GCK72_001820 [Caenorhabditis remanei]
MGIPESVEEPNLSLLEIGQSKEDGVIQRCGRVRRRGHGCELFLHKELGLRRPKTLNASELVTLDAPVPQTNNLLKFRLLLCKYSQFNWLLSCLPAHGSTRDSSKSNGHQIPAKRTGTLLETSTWTSSFSKQSLQLVKNSSKELGRTMQQKHLQTLSQFDASLEFHQYNSVTTPGKQLTHTSFGWKWRSTKSWEF